MDVFHNLDSEVIVTVISMIEGIRIYKLEQKIPL
jgi:hypothetical protein